MKFSKEEISLCKQIAKKHRKEIKHGGWYIKQLGEKQELKLHYGTITTMASEIEYQLDGILPKYSKEKHSIIPLWTISDCLEFLKERGWWLYKLIEVIGGDGFWCAITNPSENLGGRNRFERHGKTALEACLKAVLAVLEEGK